MARSQSPLHIQPPQLQPVLGSPMGEALQGFGQSMLQFFLMKQQLELKERELELSEQESKQRQKAADAEFQRQQGADQAQAAAFTGMAQQDPRMAGMIPQMTMNQDQVRNMLLQGQQAGTFDVAALGRGEGPAITQVPGMQDVSQFVQPGQSGFASNAALAGALEPMLQVKESESRISAQNAATAASVAQTDLNRQALSFQSRMMPIQLRLEQSRLSLSEQELENARRRIEMETRQFASSIIQDRLRASASFAASIAPLMGEGGIKAAQAYANRQFFGTNEQPPMNALLTSEMENLTAAMSEVGDQEQLAAFYESRERTQFAQRLNMGPEQQMAADQALQTAEGNPQAAVDLLIANPNIPDAQKAQLLPSIMAYYQMLYPGQRLKLPIKDKGFMDVMKGLFTAGTAAAGAQGATGGPGVRR